MNNFTLLAATDFSEASRRAIDRAALLADGLRLRRIELVHVVSRGSLKALKRLFSSEAGSLEARLLEEATVELHRLTDRVGDQFGIESGSFVAIGNPAGEIADYADRLSAILLVLGARGTNAARDLLLGTTAENVIRRTHRPVLVVRGDPARPYRSVLAATDFSAQSAAAMNLAQTLAPQASMALLHAVELPFEGKLQYAGVAAETVSRYRAQAERAAEIQARDFASRAAFDGTVRVEYGYPPRVIREQMEGTRPDLVAVGKHGQSAIEELLIGSVSAHVLANAACDVLVAGQPAAAAAPAA